MNNTFLCLGIILIIFNAADITLTHTALNLGAEEVNPLAARFWENSPVGLAVIKLVISLIIYGIAYGLYQIYAREGKRITSHYCVAMVGVHCTLLAGAIGWNLIQLAQYFHWMQGVA